MKILRDISKILREQEIQDQFAAQKEKIELEAEHAKQQIDLLKKQKIANLRKQKFDADQANKKKEDDQKATEKENEKNVKGEGLRFPFLLTEGDPVKRPSDPQQKNPIRCASCGHNIDFDKKEVYVSGPSYVCKTCKNMKLPANAPKNPEENKIYIYAIGGKKARWNWSPKYKWQFLGYVK